MSGRAERHRKWAHQSQNARHINAISKQAAANMVVWTDTFDTHAYYLNLQNGTLVITKHKDNRVVFTLKAHDPADRSRRSVRSISTRKPNVRSMTPRWL